MLFNIRALKEDLSLNYKHDKMERKIDLRLSMYYFYDWDSDAQRKSYVLRRSRLRASRNSALSLMPYTDKRSSMLKLPNWTNLSRSSSKKYSHILDHFNLFYHHLNIQDIKISFRYEWAPQSSLFEEETLSKGP